MDESKGIISYKNINKQKITGSKFYTKYNEDW